MNKFVKKIFLAVLVALSGQNLTAGADKTNPDKQKIGFFQGFKNICGKMSKRAKIALGIGGTSLVGFLIYCLSKGGKTTSTSQGQSSSSAGSSSSSGGAASTSDNSGSVASTKKGSLAVDKKGEKGFTYSSINSCKFEIKPIKKHCDRDGKITIEFHVVQNGKVRERVFYCEELKKYTIFYPNNNPVRNDQKKGSEIIQAIKNAFKKNLEGQDVKVESYSSDNGYEILTLPQWTS